MKKLISVLLLALAIGMGIGTVIVGEAQATSGQQPRCNNSSGC